MQRSKSLTAAADKFADFAYRIISSPSLGRWIVRSLLIVALISAVIIALLWRAYVTAPDPAALCRHKMELIASDTPQAAREAARDLLNQVEESCVANAQRRIRLEGKVPYARYARCVLAAEHLSDAERC